MSNIYIQEPATNGKVLLVTSVGDIDIELWSKEAPKACRNFVQLCMESYYDGTLFHRVMRDFIVQGGDPTGTGSGGDSIYGHPFKDEIHSRLRFVRRGLVAMANAGPNDNGSQFFFTMGTTPDLMNKHTIFGKVAGNTVYNMLKLQECMTGPDDRPLYPSKIIKTQVLANPFDDIIPRILKKKKDGDTEKKPKRQSKATKNFKLLSFGEEAEEDEEQNTKVSEGWKGKSKSSHDLANDPRLSAVPALRQEQKKAQLLAEMQRSGSLPKHEDDQEKSEQSEIVKKKLKKDKEPEDTTPKKSKPPDTVEIKPPSKSDEVKQDLQEEARQLKREIRESKKREERRNAGLPEEVEIPKVEAKPLSNDPLAEFKMERQKYKSLRQKQGRKGEREDITLALLNKFKSKLSSARTLAGDYSDEEEHEEEEEQVDDTEDLSWMHHTLQFEEPRKRKVIDANVADLDAFEIHDPRNPLTKRRREISKQKMKEKR